MNRFRLLKENEIDVRVAQIQSNWLTLLLYKDARVDMDILDETVGCLNWKREHLRDNANCVVSIYDEDKKEWVSKEDTGTESFSEAEKGLASDSFKRACVNWGIGRELYTSPFIWISKDDCNIQPKGDKYTTYDTFKVSTIGYNTFGEIETLTIKNTKTNKVVYKYGNNQTDEVSEMDYKAELENYINEHNLDKKEVCTKYKLTGKSTQIEFRTALTQLKVEQKNAS